MATINNCTSLEQSKKLAEILPFESADMWYSYYGNPKYNSVIAYEGEQWFLSPIKLAYKDIPCWSLAALLEIIPGSELSKSVDDIGKWEASAWKDPELELLMRVEGFDNPIDACYDMILKLRELKIL